MCSIADSRSCSTYIMLETKDWLISGDAGKIKGDMSI